MIMSGFKSRRGFNGVCTVYVPEGWKNYARHGKSDKPVSRFALSKFSQKINE